MKGEKGPGGEMGHWDASVFKLQQLLFPTAARLFVLALLVVVVVAAEIVVVVVVVVVV